MLSIKNICRTLLVLSAIVLTTACERRSLTRMEEGATVVKISVDWSEFMPTTPQKMTLLCYPVSGGKPVVIECDENEDKNNLEISLPAGDYKIVVLNGTLDDYVEAYNLTTEPEFGIVCADGKEPLPLGVATVEVSVPATQIEVGDDGVLRRDGVTVEAPELVPHDITWTYNVLVHVDAYNGVNQLTAQVTGLVQEYGKTSPLMNRVITSWDKVDAKMLFRNTFRCLGYPNATVGDSQLLLRFAMNDGKVKEQSIPVATAVTIDEGTKTYTIEVTSTLNDNVPNSGYDIEIKPWEDETESTRRAPIRGRDEIYDDGFVCSVMWSDYQLYSNYNIYWNGSSFVPSRPMFWPAASTSNPCTFYAVSCPGLTDKPMDSSDGNYSLNFTTALNAADQGDLLVSRAVATEIPSNGMQKLVFSHALTKVNFTVYVEDNEDNQDYVWRVSSVSVKARNCGTYTFGANPAWSVTGDMVDMEYLTSNTTVDVETNAKYVGQNNFMLIPQGNVDLEVTVKWNVLRKLGDTYMLLSQSEASRTYTINASDWAPAASRRYSNLRLPNIGESTLGGSAGLDDNNMTPIGYQPDCN